MITAAATLLLASLVAARFNDGVGKLPAMGYDTYNAFGSHYNGSVALEQIAAMKQLGLIDLGYNTVSCTSTRSSRSLSLTETTVYP
jgi:alpha-galactosidase